MSGPGGHAHTRLQAWGAARYICGNRDRATSVLTIVRSGVPALHGSLTTTGRRFGSVTGGRCLERWGEEDCCEDRA